MPGTEIRVHVENRHGAPVQAFSDAKSEYEVLMPSRVRYRVLRSEVFTEANDEIAFRNAGQNRKRIEVYVEQIED